MTYKIVGADGKEYGPVTTEQLRQWIQEGRADAQTKALAEGGAEWMPLAALPEFADLFATVQPPRVEAVHTEEWAGAVLARDYQLDIGGCFSRAWGVVKGDFWLLVGASVVAWLIASLPYVGILLAGPMMGGLFVLYLKRIRGQSATFGDAFCGFSLALLQLLLGSIVSSLLSGLGLVLCLLPGIYLGVAWVFTLPLIIDKKLDFWPAMELSRKVVSRHWWTLFGLMLLCGLVTVAGVLGCLVGVFVTGTISGVAMICAYEEIFGNRPAHA